MKKQNNSIKRTRLLSLALCAAGCAAFGQGPGGGPGGPGGGFGGGPGQGGPGRHGPPPLPPVFRALDTNHDGIIEADEIANAPESLKTLEKSGSDELTIPELLGPPPRGPRRRQGQGQGQPPGPPPALTGTQSGGADSQNGPPPPPEGQGGQGDDQNGPPGPPPGPPPGGPGGHRRPPPVIEALDTNHDGIIEADEIANAAESLKTLEKNGSDQLTIQDLLGPPPGGPRGQGRGDDRNGPGGPPPDDNGPGGPPPDGQAPPGPSQSGSSAQSDAAPPPPPQ